MNTRPEFNASGLPASIVIIIETKAARQWCFVAPDGGSFYVDEATAKAMQAEHGGDVFPPKSTVR